MVVWLIARGGNAKIIGRRARMDSGSRIGHVARGGTHECPESPASRLDARQVSRARSAVMRGSRGSPEERRASFLAEAGAIIGSSLDYDRVLPRLARLALPVMGDLCAIDLLQVDGSIARVASAHVDS